MRHLGVRYLGVSCRRPNLSCPNNCKCKNGYTITCKPNNNEKKLINFENFMVFSIKKLILENYLKINKNFSSNSLTYLKIMNCNLNSLMNIHTANLIYLNLTRNSIQDLKGFLKARKILLQIFILSYNPLSDFDAVLSFENLRKLDLSYTRITHLYKNALMVFKFFEQLLIKGCTINFIEKDILYQDNLKSLDLSSSILPRNRIKYLVKNLKNIENIQSDYFI